MEGFIYPVVIHSLVIGFGQVKSFIYERKRLIHKEIVKLLSEWVVTNNHSKLYI